MAFLGHVAFYHPSCLYSGSFTSWANILYIPFMNMSTWLALPRLLTVQLSKS